MMNNTEQYKPLLEKERDLLVSELQKVGRINPDDPTDWEPTGGEQITPSSNEDERADVIEEFGDRAEVEIELEDQLKLVNEALERIATGTYGICVVDGNPIEEKRLLANPSATTCIAHREHS